MSGFEIAGVVLGAFPLILSGLEKWREVAEIGGFYWRIRTEHKKCRRDVQYHMILYKRSLKELLLPMMDDRADVTRLVDDPGDEEWQRADLQKLLEERLMDSYEVYFDIIKQLNETAATLRDELCLDKITADGTGVIKTVPETTSSTSTRILSMTRFGTTTPSSSTQVAAGSQTSTIVRTSSSRARLVSAKMKIDYESFRVKFALRKAVRDDLFSQLTEYNGRLEKLLSTSDKMSALHGTTKPRKTLASVTESVLCNARKRSEHLFRALQRSWNCSCQEFHTANLRLEHRTQPNTSFQLILEHTPTQQVEANWTWKELHCGNSSDCKVWSAASPRTSLESQSQSRKQKRVAFQTSEPLELCNITTHATETNIDLCHALGADDRSSCMGIIAHEGEAYHLHPYNTVRRPVGPNDNQITLDRVLSGDHVGCLSRRQRYSMALHVASSFTQLHATSWLTSGLRKEEIIFFSKGPTDTEHLDLFINSDFPIHEAMRPRDPATSFFSLGILLLELCFGCRLEDHPLRKKQPVGDEETKAALDLMAAIKWSQSVADEGGDDYASAVRWCFTGSGGRNWEKEMIRNVVSPLEMCQQHFQATSLVTSRA